MPSKPKNVNSKKLSRMARRMKQRAENDARAKLMRRFRLDHTPIDNSHHASSLPMLNVGCSGWFYWHWRGVFYPHELALSQWFAYYTKRFKTVELNAPFYSWSLINTVKNWLRQAKKYNIIYSVKVCELITHIKQFNGTKTLIKDFGFIADLLGPYCGCFLFQMPPSFHYSKARLKKIISQLEPHRRNVVEFRHASWWNEEVYAAFKKANIIFCSCSGPKTPDDLIKTADDVYIRFHGTSAYYTHCYSPTELSVWSKKIKSSKAKHVFIYFNNDRNGYAIKNAKSLLRKLKA